MSSYIKLTAGIIATALGLVLILALYLILTFDANRYRSEITTRVHIETGRKLTLQGDIELQLFPWIGLRLGATQLSGPEDFSQPDFIAIDSASIKVRLLPLLQQQLEVDTISLQGLKVNLVTAANGSNNWDFSGNTLPPSNANAVAPASPAPVAAALTQLQINGLDLRNASINWLDLRNQTRLTLDRLSLTTGPIRPANPVDIDVSLNLSGEPSPRQPIDLHLTSRALFNPSQQTLQLSELTLKAGKLELSGDINTTRLNTEPAFSGHLRVARFNPRTLLGQLDIEVPSTSDATVLQSVTANLQFSGHADQIDINDITIRMDETTLKGQTQLQLSPHLATTFTLTIDTLDLDRYLAPASTTTTASPTPVAAAPTDTGLPLELMRTLDIQGQARIDTFKVAGLNAGNLSATLTARNGQLKLTPFQTDLYQGHASGSLNLDARPAQPRFSAQATLDGLQVEPFLLDLLDSNRVTGQAAVKMDISSQGNSVDELTRHLGGTASLRFNDGAIKGLNIADLIRRARAALEKRPPPADTLQQTDFTQLSASLNISNGVITNQDLSAQAPFLRLSGTGNINLVKETIDYHLNARVTKDDQGQGGADLASLQGTTIPIRIHGPLASPAIKLDNSAIRDSLRQQAEQSIKKKVDEKQDDIKTRLQEQTRDKLKQKLKKLF